MNVIVLDTETTGMAPPVVPVELATLELVGTPLNFVGGASFYSRFNPGRPIEPGAIAAHHIIPTDVENAPPWQGYELPPDTYLIGHNIDYDWNVIGAPPHVRRICTLALSRAAFPDIGSHKLTAMYYHMFGATNATRNKLAGAHSASVDVELCAQVLCGILTEYTELLPLGGRRLDSWEDLYELSELARVPIRMPFGKHGPKDGRPGQLIADLDRIDPGYRQWMLKQRGIDPYLRRALLERR